MGADDDRAKGAEEDAAGNTDPSSGSNDGQIGIGWKSSYDISKVNIRMAVDIIDAMEPPLSEASRDALLNAISEEGCGISAITWLDLEGLKELGISSLLERAQILAAASNQAVMAPAPKQPGGGPLVVEVKIGFVALGQVDTVTQTAWARFFVDLYWHDPRLIGATSVPDGTWFPKGIYIPNSAGDLCIDAYEKPVMMDSATGKLLWAQEIQGQLVNRMDLSSFPFDHDAIEVFVHQAEDSNRDEYVLRPAGGGWNGYRTRSDEETIAMESTSVNFFFDVFEELDEWLMHGYTTEAWETIGGNGMEYSWYKVHLHVTRRWSFYVWKIVLPLFICTIFCMSSFLFDIQDLEARNNTSVTMFLATSALLYVVASLLPKTSFLTDIDKFVVASLGIQFGIGVWSWFAYKMLVDFDDDVVTVENKTIDNYVMLVSFVTYLFCTIYFFRVPILQYFSELRQRRSVKYNAVAPLSLKGDALIYHELKRFKNVWPKPPVGEKPPNALDPHKLE